MKKEGWKEYNDWLKEAIPENYKSIYTEDTEEQLEKARFEREKRKLEKIQYLRDTKLEEIENYKIIISIAKHKLTGIREDLSDRTIIIAHRYHEEILNYEEKIKNESDQWFLIEYLKKLEKCKQGYYGSKMVHYTNWLKHLYKELNKWEDDCNEN